MSNIVSDDGIVHFDYAKLKFGSNALQFMPVLREIVSPRSDGDFRILSTDVVAPHKHLFVSNWTHTVTESLTLKRVGSIWLVVVSAGTNISWQ